MRKLVLMLVIAITIINLVYWLARDKPPQTAPAHTDAPQSTAPSGKHIDGRTVTLLGVPVRVNASGELIVDTHIRQLFDTLAIQHADEPVDHWKRQVLQSFQQDLPAPALATLQDAFDRYVEFNLALQLLPMEGAPHLQAVLQRVQTLRSHYLGHYADPLYNDWSALETFTRQYLEIMTQQRDDKAARKQLETLASQLPEPVQARARNMIRHSAEDFAVDDMAILEPQAYTRMLQEQAAVSLIETTLLFDEPSAAFMGQYEQYSEQKRDLLLSDLPEAEQQQQLKALRRQYFQGSDILRVETLDRAEAF